jgi:hypothetical protein
MFVDFSARTVPDETILLSPQSSDSSRLAPRPRPFTLRHTDVTPNGSPQSSLHSKRTKGAWSVRNPSTNLSVNTTPPGSNKDQSARPDSSLNFSPAAAITQSIVEGMENVLGCDLDGDGTKGAGYGLVDGLEAVRVTVSVIPVHRAAT